nr:hypothetical protein [Paludisphaera borealis]
MKNSGDFDPSVAHGPVKEKMPGLPNAIRRSFDSIAAVPEMVGAGGRGDFRPGVAAMSLGVLGHVEDGLNQKGFVADPGLLAELRMCSFQDRFDIPLGLGGEPVELHRLLATGTACAAIGRSPAESPDEVGELLIPFEPRPFTPIQRGERLGCQAPEDVQFLFVLPRLLLQQPQTRTHYFAGILITPRGDQIRHQVVVVIGEIHVSRGHSRPS